MLTILFLNQQQTGSYTQIFKKHFSQGFFLSISLFNVLAEGWSVSSQKSEYTEIS